MSWSCDRHYVDEFSFHYTNKLTLKKCLKIGKVVSEKSKFNCHM